MRNTRAPHLILLVLMLFLIGSLSMPSVQAQPAGWSGDDNLAFRLLINGISAAESDASHPITVLLSEDPTMNLTIFTGDNIILRSGLFVMNYMGVPLFNQPLEFNLPVPAGTNVSLTNTTLPLGAALGGGGLELVSGTISGSFSFVYSLVTAPDTNVTVSEDFYLHIGPTGAAALMSVSGLITVGFTLMSIFGLLLALDDFQQGILWASKVRRAVSEQRTTIFPRGVVLRRRPRKRDEVQPNAEELAPKVERIAQGLWDGKRCPKCRKRWKSHADSCAKCNITRQEAQTLFAKQVAEMVPRALKVMKPKSKMPVGAFSKALKVKPDVGGAVAAALTELHVFQTRSVKVPLKKVAFSGMTIAGTYWSWMQMLGGATPAWSDVLLSIAAGLVVSVIIGYFLNWLARMPRLGYDES
ncbi:MAG: hypothetical protein ACTSYL_13015 [Candidatus Thorarchaeota archaeon]